MTAGASHLGRDEAHLSRKTKTRREWGTQVVAQDDRVVDVRLRRS